MSKPVSILDRDGPRPIIVKKNDDSEIVIPLVTLLFTLVFFGYLLYLLIISNFEISTSGNRVSSDQRTTSVFQCPPGSCPTEITTGYKSCDINNDSFTNFNPAFQVCNQRFLCTNNLTPFAQLSSGGTNIYGVCEPNTECGCLSSAQCPEYVLSVFTSHDGNAYQPVAGQRILFPQITSNTQPIVLSNSSTQFCAVPLSWLPLSNPGCNFIGAPEGDSMTYNDLLVCMGAPKKCSGEVATNPCLQGVLAIVTNDSDSLTQDNIQTAQYSCVAGTPGICECNEVYVYDTNFGNIICKQLL